MQKIKFVLKIFKNIVFLMTLAILLSGCHADFHSSGKKIQPEKNGTVLPHKNTPALSQPSEMKLPADYRPVKSVLEHTSFIGTTDRPTIDGGIINAASGIPVEAAPAVFEVSHAMKKINNSNSSNEAKTEPKIAAPFNDHWATSRHVKQLLVEAAKDGRLNYVLKKSSQMNLPASVAIVPMVESNYKTHAVSPKGAQGAWQLMPETAEAEGLKNKESFQFTASTKAALTLLAQLHRQFGNWTLAYAAYNAGSSRVEMALKENPHAMTINELNLPLQTKHYVKHIMDLNKKLKQMRFQDV